MYLTRNQFKIIAIMLMIIDHVGYALLNNNVLCRGIGRLAFPMFVFLLLDGFHRTRDVEKYARRLLLFWVVSIVPYSLAFYGGFTAAGQNIFLSLFLYLGLFCVLDNQSYPVLMKALIATLSAVIAIQAKMEYSWYGVVITVIMFYFQERGLETSFTGVFCTSFIYGMLNGFRVQIFAALSFIFIPATGKFEESQRPNKITSMMTYWFYPIHLLCLGVWNL